MNHRTIYLAVTLSFIALASPRLASQETRDSIRTRHTAAQKVKGPSHKGAGSADQPSYHAPAKIDETETRVSEAEGAERFMQLKTQVNADLIRLEDARNIEPSQSSVRASRIDFHVGGSPKLSSGNQIKDSRAQVMGDAQPAPSKSAADSNNK